MNILKMLRANGEFITARVSLQAVYIFVLTFLFVTCTADKQKTTDSSTEKLDSVSVSYYKHISFKTFDFKQASICELKQLEFIDIYERLDSIADDRYEIIVTAEKLKEFGFTQTFWGRGNWQEGPRMINVTYSNNSCDCDVDKLYYSTEKENEYIVTETINCKPKK